MCLLGVRTLLHSEKRKEVFYCRGYRGCCKQPANPNECHTPAVGAWECCYIEVGVYRLGRQQDADSGGRQVEGNCPKKGLESSKPTCRYKSQVHRSPFKVSVWIADDPGIGWISLTPLQGVLAIPPTLFRGEHAPVVDCAHGC